MIKIFSVKNYKKVLYIFFVVVVLFFFEFVQGICVYAEESFQDCLELINPSDRNDLIELRLCIKKINISKNLKKANQIIFNSYEGSNILTEKIINRIQQSEVLLE